MIGSHLIPHLLVGCTREAPRAFTSHGGVGPTRWAHSPPYCFIEAPQIGLQSATPVGRARSFGGSRLGWYVRTVGRSPSN